MQEEAPPSTLSGDAQEQPAAGSALLTGGAYLPSSDGAFPWGPSYFQPEPEGAPPAGRPPKAGVTMAAEGLEGGWPAARLPRLSRKTWMVVSVLEFAVILILAAGLAHLVATRGDEGEEEEEEERAPWTRGRLASLQSMNETLRQATLLWEACENETRVLNANVSSLGSEVTQLSSRLRMAEFENGALEDKVDLLRNLTQHLQEMNNQQKEIIQHFRQQQRKSSGGRSLHATLAPLAMVVAGILLL